MMFVIIGDCEIVKDSVVGLNAICRESSTQWQTPI